MPDISPGGADGHLRLDPCSRVGSPIPPGAQTKASESLVPPPSLTCIPSVQKCCGRNWQNISRGCFLSPRLHTEAGPSSLPLHPGTRHTPTAAHKQVSREALGGSKTATRRRLHQRLPQTAWRDRILNTARVTPCLPNLTPVTLPSLLRDHDPPPPPGQALPTRLCVVPACC